VLPKWSAQLLPAVALACVVGTRVCPESGPLVNLHASVAVVVHWPAVHVDPRGHTFPQAPQLLGSLVTGDISAISPAVRMTSALIHFSLVVSTVVIASPMRRRASEGHPLRRSAAQHIELVAKKDFSLQSHPRPE
jgi:hypothetical protein